MIFNDVTPAPAPANLMTMILDDVTEDPNAAVKIRRRRIAELLWWVHLWQDYVEAADEQRYGFREIPEPITLIEVAAGAGLCRKQARRLKVLPRTTVDELVTLRIVTEIVDS